MKITDTPLVDCKIIEPAVWGDDRGFFIETYKKADLAQAGITVDFVQDNHSKSAK
jgi:dTDP-4-dehydrorhamnose 3,5-epimerase